MKVLGIGNAIVDVVYLTENKHCNTMKLYDRFT